MATGRRRRAEGAYWQQFRWQVRVLDKDGEPIGRWLKAASLTDARAELEIHDNAVRAQIKKDGDPYAVLEPARRDGRGVVPVLRRVTSFEEA